MARLPIQKTWKLFIGGKFPRTECGRYLQYRNPKGEHVANYCKASRKDLRDAVRAARNAQPGWAKATGYLRGQILYRMAEMLESRQGAFVEDLKTAGASAAEARAEVEASVDRLVYTAGWSDKYEAVFGTVNPVAGPYWNVTAAEPTGVVGLVCPDHPGLLGLVTLMASAIVAGNSVIILASDEVPLPSISLAEVLSTSDLPGGVVNILTGDRAELVPHLASHMDVNAIVDGSGDATLARELDEGSGFNLKRVHRIEVEDWTDNDSAANPYRILDTVEFKTAWHTMGY